MIATLDRIAADRSQLAEYEAEFAVGSNGPYLEWNLATYRRRVARYGPPVAVHVVPVSAVTAGNSAPTPPAVRLDREARIRRLAAVLDGTDAEVQAAIDDGTDPEEFALLLTDGTAVDRVARRISLA